MSPPDRDRLPARHTADTSQELIGLVYDAAAEPARWPLWFEHLSESVGRRASNLVIHGFGPTRYVSLDTPESGFETMNPRRVFENKALSQRSFSMAFVDGEIVEEWSQLHSGGAQSASGIHVFGDQTRTLFASDRALLRDLLPHLHRALVMHFRFDSMRRERDHASRCLDELATGIFVLDSRARVLHANCAALDYVDGPYGLRIDHGVLSPREPGVDEAFRSNLTRVTSARPSPMCGQPLTCGATLWLRGLGSDRAVAYVASDHQERPVAAQMLVDAFQLSTAQARVGSLLAFGHSTDDIAVELGLSPHTVRAHVKKIQQRTGTHRQATLVRRLLESVPRVRF